MKLKFGHTLFFYYDFIVLEQFKVHSKTEGKVQRFTVYSLPHTCIVSPVISVPQPQQCVCCSG